MTSLSTSERFCLADEICFSPVTDEGCIVLNLERSTVLSLNDTGALIFAKLAAAQDGLTRSELIDVLKREFEETETSRIEQAVDSLLRRLEQTGTLQTDPDGARMRGNLRGALALRVPVCVRYALRPLLFVKAYTCAALLLLFTGEVVRKLGGFRSIHESVKRWAAISSSTQDDLALASACSAVNRACTWHPKRSLCLQRASVLVCLLRSLGFPAQMVIGVHKMPFYGHAWAELGGQVVNDHPNAQKFFHELSRC